DQFLGAERTARHSELERQQPCVGCEGVEKPSELLLLRSDFDHRTGIPASGAEVTPLLDAFDDGSQDPAIPSAACARPIHAILRMPARAVDLPGHGGLSADLRNINVVLARLVQRGRIEALPDRIRSSLEHVHECLACIRSMKYVCCRCCSSR